MDCQEVQDRFSALWEKELLPFEEKLVKGHLSSCPQCRREFEQFEKTMQWLHSAGEVEVPDGFLTGLYKKVEERKRLTSVEKSGKRWFNFPRPLKLPVQAVAMVAIVFLVLYLTKMMPMEKYRLREPGQTSSSFSLKKKSDHALVREEEKRERVAPKPAPEVPRSSVVEKTKGPVSKGTGQVPKEKQVEEASVPQPATEKKKSEAPAQGPEVLVSRAAESKEEGSVKVPSPELEKGGKGQPAMEKSLVASKPPREIILKTSNRDKTASQLHELVKQFGGEIVSTEGDRFLASLPAGLVSKFEKELAELSVSSRADKAYARKPDPGDLMALRAGKKEEVDKKGKEPAKLADGEEGRVVIRILLVQE